MSWLTHELRTARWRIRQKYFQNYVFVHIPKTAGTSINLALDLSMDHIRAIDLRGRLGRERWDKKFKFSFVRNPWDKVVSYYQFKSMKKDPRFHALSFSDYLKRVYIDRDPLHFSEFPQIFLPQFDWLSDNSDNLIVDFVGRFENVQEDFAKICERIGKPGITLPHQNAVRRADYRSYYQDKDIEIIANWYKKDIEHFGYTF